MKGCRTKMRVGLGVAISCVALVDVQSRSLIFSYTFCEYSRRPS